jgi:hypothetical protein
MLSSHKEQVRFLYVVFGCSAHFKGRRQGAAEVVARQDFAVEDELDKACCNHTMWYGLLGEVTPYPLMRRMRIVL